MQSTTQNIIINVFDVSSPGETVAEDPSLSALAVPNTGDLGAMLSNILASPSGLALAIFFICMLSLAIILFIMACRSRRSRKKSAAALSIFGLTAMLLTIMAQPINPALAASSLEINRSTVIFNINKHDPDNFIRQANITTTVTTDNETGYTLKAKLDRPPTDGIAASLNDKGLTTTEAEIYADYTNTSPSLYQHNLAVEVPNTIAIGSYQFDIVYGISENAANAPVPAPPNPGDSTKVVPSFASTVTPSGDGSGSNGPQFSMVGENFGSSPVVTIGGKACTDVRVNSEGTALTCTGPITGMTDGVKRVTINGVDPGDEYTIRYSSYGFPTLQTAVPSDCSQDPAIFRDTRDSQLYYVAELPDGKCWMLDNLKYKPNGDTTGTITSGFSADQIWTGGLSKDGTDLRSDGNYDVAKYGDPIASPSGDNYCVGNTNLSLENIIKCGFIYNFYTATAGTATQSETSGLASGSICPDHWNLPRGYNYPDFRQNDFAILNGFMAGDGEAVQGSMISDKYIKHWIHSGEFKVVYSGTWRQAGYLWQGGEGRVWSSTIDNGYFARYLYISNNIILTGTGSSERSFGASVRCIVGP